ncbi:MAG: GGDEF domain-containing protein [Helicobacteraceae bacterium]|nr:GGDEF domain-containing protein [Candidatus Sulfurimonas ponti]
MSSTQKLYPYLFSVVDDIEKHKVYIATSWVKKENITDIFNKRKISPKKFRDGYGVPILEYFIAVIKEEKPLGDCPVMSKLVHYLLKKDITPQEVFNICMDFRSSLRTYLFTKDEIINNPLSFADEIARIMDANLSGVLNIFTNIYKDTKLKLQQLESQKNKLLEEKEQIQEDVSIDKLTGLINYITFEKLIKDKINNALKNNIRLFLSVIDIPNLREINLEKGREFGDGVINGVADEIKTFDKEYIALGRLEGERFGVLLESSKEQEAYDWCVALYKNISDKDEKLAYCITEVDYAEAISKLFLRAYDLIDEANTNEEIIINTDFRKIIPFKELSDQSEFTNELKKMKTIESVLYYKELPLNNESTIKEVTSQHIQITASKKQIKMAKIGKYMYFKIDKLGNIKATVNSIDEDRHRVSLDTFKFDIHSPLDRKLYRVKAADDFRAYIRDNNRDYNVEVLDMNNKYIAVEIDRKRNFDIDASFVLHVRMIIDGVAYNFETTTTIKRVEKVLGGYKFVLFCHLDTKNEEIIQEYLASFQRNIIKDFQK